MPQVLVIADDLTGANATGARFARAGLRAATVTPQHLTSAGEYDVLLANTDSRHLAPERAAALVSDAIEAVWPVGLVVKRTDTTLRGNIGAELAAAWQSVRDRVPAHVPVRALLAPAHPESGRVTVDGAQLLHGTPLEQTELARDPLTPIHTSRVTEILAEQTHLGVHHLPMRTVTAPGLSEELATTTQPVVLCDALTEAHLHAIARAAAEVHERDGTVWVSVDPGPCGVLLATELGIRGHGRTTSPLLAVVGSATEITRCQVDRLTNAGSGPGEPTFLDVDPAALTGATGIDAHSYTTELARQLSQALMTHAFPATVVLRTATTSADVVELPPTARQELPTRLAGVVAEALHQGGTPSGLYTTGGEVTAAVLAGLHARAFEVGGEVLPLAVHGTIVGGSLDGTPMATKGGLIGDDDAANACLRQLRQAVSRSK